jgi:hypothetical protein
MGVRILTGHEQGTNQVRACLFDSVTEWAFGPVFYDYEDGTSADDVAESFLIWLREADNRDPRQIPDLQLEELYGQFLTAETNAS